MSFNSAILNYERNETMLSGPHFKRKTMVTAYESDIVPVVEDVEPLDPDLIYHWDFTCSDPHQEKITKNSMFDMTANLPLNQVQDFNGDTGILLGNNNNNNAYKVENGGSSFPLSTFDHIDKQNLTIIMEYSVEDEFDLVTHTQNQDTCFKFSSTFLYKFGTVESSQNADDALQPSGMVVNLNSKDRKYFPRLMPHDTSSLPTLTLQEYRPTYNFYSANTFDWRCVTVQGTFPYNRSGKHTLAWGYRTKTDGLYFFTYHDKETFLEKRVSTIMTYEMFINRHLPMITIQDSDHPDCIVNLKSYKIFNRFLEANEIPNRVDRFPFLYHFILGKTSTYKNRTHGNITAVIGSNHVQYAQFDDNIRMYSLINTGFGIDMNSPVIWYEYELEIRSSTSTFAIDFFNIYANSSTYTDNYFSSSFDGICFGVDGNQLIKYKCGNTITTTSTTFPLNTKKYISFAYTTTEVKFYYDKTLIGTVLKTTDDSLWNHISSQSGDTRFGVFNLGLSSNRAHFLVRHSFTEDRGTMNNDVLI